MIKIFKANDDVSLVLFSDGWEEISEEILLSSLDIEGYTSRMRLKIVSYTLVI